MLRRNSRSPSKNTNSDDEESEDNVDLKLTDFRLLTFENSHQVMGLYLTEDDKNYFINDAHTVLADRMIVFDEDSVGIDVIGKHSIKAVSLPSINSVVRYISTMQERHEREQFALHNRDQEPFPTTQFSYLTEGPITTHH